MGEGTRPSCIPTVAFWCKETEPFGPQLGTGGLGACALRTGLAVLPEALQWSWFREMVSLRVGGWI